MVTFITFGVSQAFSVTSKADTIKGLQGNEYKAVSEEELIKNFMISGEEIAEYAAETPTVSSYKFNMEKAFVNTIVNLSVTLDGVSSDATCRFIAQGGNYPYGMRDKYFTMNKAIT